MIDREREEVQQVSKSIYEEYKDIPSEVVALLWGIFSKRNQYKCAKEFESQIMSRSFL